MKKKIIFPMIMLLLLIVVTVGVTFAAFTFTKEGQVENTLETSTIMLTYTEGKTGIMLNEAYPMSDDKGKVLVGENNVFDFTVQATLGTSTVISYEVSAVKLPITDVTPLENDEVKLYLEKAIDPDTTYQEVLAPSNFLPIESQTEVGSPIGSMILDSGAFYTKGTTIHNYRLRMWIDEETEIPSGESRKYGVKVNVYAKQLLSDSFTDESCFTFDASTGTITDYDNSCPKDVVIPYMIDGVKVNAIGNGAFAGNLITSVVFPSSISEIEESAFSRNRLTSLNIPNTVTFIGKYAFFNNSLTNVVLSNRISTIEEGTFQQNSLIDVKIPISITSIQKNAFYLNKINSFIIPNSVTFIGESAFNANQLPDERAFIYQRNQDGSIDYTTIVSYGGAKRENVIIPNVVTTIGPSAFLGNNLTKIVNQTGRSFDWNEIITGITGTPFVTGSVGNVIITDQ